MRLNRQLFKDLKQELKWIFSPKYKLIASLSASAIVCIIIFFISLYTNNFKEGLVPFSAIVVLLWTFADSSISNVLFLDKEHTSSILKYNNDLVHHIIVKNLAIMVMAIPFCIMFGLVMALTVGSFSNLIFIIIASSIILMGWLGMSDVISVMHPFERRSAISLFKRERGWITYCLKVALGWIVLPIYSAIILLPFTILHWHNNGLDAFHKLIALSIMTALSLTIWLLSINYCKKYLTKENIKLKDLIEFN